MLDHLKTFYIRRAFRPGILGLFINPFYSARKELFLNVASLSPHVSGRLLDVGCGHKPYRSLFTVTEYVGLELDTPENRRNKKADYYYDGNVFPFDDASFDTVIANQVLEHVFDPDVFLHEISRVLPLSGIVLLTVPFIWAEHEKPFDYARYSSFGLKHLLEKHGFTVIEFRKSVQDIRVYSQLINCYFHKMVENWNVYFKVLAWFILTSPFNILGEILYKILPKNPDIYLDNIVIARKEGHNDRAV